VKAPDLEIHKAERIGRRAFGREKNIYSESNGVKHYKLGVFLDTRGGGWSVDRLGVNQAIKKRISFLDPLGIKMGEGRGQKFRGWVQLNVTQFHELVLPTPATDEVNPHHAEIFCDNHFPTSLAKRIFAISLCDMAREFDFIYSPTSEADAV
jgi:hypothetical protein